MCVCVCVCVCACMRACMWCLYACVYILYLGPPSPTPQCHIYINNTNRIDCDVYLDQKIFASIQGVAEYIIDVFYCYYSPQKSASTQGRLTTVAVPPVGHLDDIGHPEGLAVTRLGTLVTLAMTRTVVLAH